MTPEVSLGAATVELACAGLILWRGARTPVRVVAAMTCVLLAGYQICEHAICRSGGDAWLCRAGFAIIALLPATTLHIARLLTGRRLPMRAIYGIFGLLAVWVLVDPAFVSGATCSLFYVHYQHGNDLNLIYGFSYEIALLVLIVVLWPARRERRALAMLIGVILFFVPSWIVYFVLPSTRTAHPSLMCIFAFELSLALLVVSEVITWPRQRHRATERPAR